MMLEKHRM